jgi:hypothetical protein
LTDAKLNIAAAETKDNDIQWMADISVLSYFGIFFSKTKEYHNKKISPKLT